MNSKVSICIPTWNAELFLEKAVSSAINQSYKDIEILIVDNCSTDSTEKLIKKMQCSDVRIKYIKNEINVGLISNFNKCLQFACGDYIKFLCSDDELHPACVEEMVTEFEADPSLELISSARMIIDETGKQLSFTRFLPRKVKMSGPGIINKCLFERNYIGEPSAVMFKAISAKRGFREDFQQLADVDMWFYLLEHGNILFLPEPLCCIRNHKEQATEKNQVSGVFFDDYFRLFNEYSEKPYMQYTCLNLIKRKIALGVLIWRASSKLMITKRRKIMREHYSYGFYYLIIPLVIAFLFIQSQIILFSWNMKKSIP